MFIQQGTPYDEAVRTIGHEPTFSYVAYSKQIPDTDIVFSKKLKFGVYGWDLDTSWYGMQTTNDTVVTFYKFKSRQQYKEYVTPPSEIIKRK